MGEQKMVIVMSRANRIRFPAGISSPAEEGVVLGVSGA
jgi:hypothetical protein